MFSITFRRGACQQTAITPIAVQIRGEGRRRVIKTQDVCRAWSRRRKVRLPGVDVVVADGSEDDTPRVRILPRTYSKTRSYKVEIVVGRKRVLRGRLVAKGYTVRPRRIYEGTDAFVNYCLNPDDPKRLRSAGLRLYCNTAGYRRTRIRWQRGSG